jgi:Uncharacterized protein involved in outer membrane biogenesis
MRRHFVRVLAVVVVLAMLAVIFVFGLANTDWGRAQIQKRVVASLQGAVHGILRVGSVSGNLLKGFTLNDLVITDSAGAPFVKIDSASARYSLRALYAQQIDFDAVRLVHPVIVLDRQPGGKWNWDRILPHDTIQKPGQQKNNWGKVIRLTDVTMIDGDITARSPWAPKPTPGKTDAEVLRYALGPDGRFALIKVPNGYQKVSEFHHVNAKIPFLRFEDPAYKTRHVDIAALSMTAAPFKPPTVDVKSLVGSFDFTPDSIWWQNAKAALPGSRLAGSGRYNIDNDNLTLRLHADTVSAADLRWVDPNIPVNGGGKLDFGLDWVGDTSVYVARNADLQVEKAHLSGDLGITYRGQAFSIQNTDGRFSNLDTKLIERVFPTVKIPRSGILNGRAKVKGDKSRLAVDADITFDDRQAGRNRIVALGAVDIDGNKYKADNLKLTMLPVQLEVLRSYAKSLPSGGGTLTGTATLNGDQKSLGVNADVAIDNPKVGRSHILAVGNVGMLNNDFRASNLRLTMRPLQVALLRSYASNLPIGGTITGTATLNGSMLSRMTAKADVTHVDRGDTSHLTGNASFRAAPNGKMAGAWFDVDAMLHPLSLAEAGRMYPAAGLRGSASGPIRLTGTLSNLDVKTKLDFGDGGSLGLTGKFNLAGRDKTYDATVDANLFNANAIFAKGPRTSVTGTIVANGHGFDPATMQANIAADLQGSSYDTLSLTGAKVRLSAANGMATIDTLSIIVPEGVVNAKGSFGLAAGRIGQLTYHVNVDSLNRLGQLLPPATTGEVLPRPGILAGRLAKARADSLRIAKATEVERAITGRAAPTLAKVDTPQVLSMNTLSGALRADGVATGNIKSFGLKGTASGENIIARGNTIGKFNAQYDWTNALSPQSRVDIDAGASRVVAGGFSLDSLHTEGHLPQAERQCRSHCRPERQGHLLGQR